MDSAEYLFREVLYAQRDPPEPERYIKAAVVVHSDCLWSASFSPVFYCPLLLFTLSYCLNLSHNYTDLLIT